ncbi:MAG: hypothetical protein EHM34_08720 [Nitrosopumilales archaeon]|nr:MAG: hypothetical protein EHM34_08720 [Nitrosopumilales archaeon]
MIHRHLHKLFTQGIDIITKDMSILDDLFYDNYALTEEELTSIKTYFTAKGLNIVNGYPRSDSVFPLLAIILSADREAETFLNDDAEPISDRESSYFNMDLKSSIWEYTYNFLIISEHPDITAYYYEIAKSILLIGYPQLEEIGCFDFALEGSELAPDLRYLPEHLFYRQLTFRVRMEFQQFDKESKFKKAFKVVGIHIDKNASNYDIGGVKDNVKPYRLEE